MDQFRLVQGSVDLEMCNIHLTGIIIIKFNVSPVYIMPFIFIFLEVVVGEEVKGLFFRVSCSGNFLSQIWMGIDS